MGLCADFQAGVVAYKAHDYATAIENWRPIAEQGSHEAQYNMGLMYANGYGVPQDNAQAAQWYEKAAQQGYARAANALLGAEFDQGLTYDLGNGATPDYPEAEKWYRQAAEKGYGPALINIGVLYYNGSGEKRDLVLAHEYFLLGQMKGDPRASNLLEVTTNKLSKKQMKRASDLAQQWMAAHAAAEIAQTGH
jgi:TPR repeat protein